MGELVIHAISSGIGESLVLQMPCGGWGVIDCYASSINNPKANPTLRFLQARKVDTLEFLCLTHPHEDHFRGMHDLIDNFSIKEFWRFGGLTAMELADIGFFYTKFSDAKNPKCFIPDVGKAYTLVNESVKRRRKNGGISRIVLVSNRSQLYSTPKDKNDFLIQSIAPSSERDFAYREGLKKFSKHKTRPSFYIPHQEHNKICVALLITYGEAKVILGSDVESDGWSDILSYIDPEDIDIDVVKVSHHGSTNGYTENLWSIFSKTGKPVAIVIPFYSQNLPNPDALHHISQHSRCLISPCPLVSRDADISKPDYSFKVKTLLKTLVRGYRVLASDSGVCSITIQKDGTCIHSRSEIDVCL
jgi:hypothetical protein